MSEISDRVKFITGDCIGAMQAMDENSVDAICTDPPYGLEFMGKEWDRLGPVERQNAEGGGDRRAVVDPEAWMYGGDSNPYSRSRVRWQHGAAGPGAMQEWHHAWATEALRVLKPGGYLLAFGGTRTYHRLACASEDAGFEIRDTIAWLYGSGFPKSLDVSKAIDKAAGAEREVVGEGSAFGRGARQNRSRVEQGYRPTEVSPDGGVAQITAPATPDAERWQGWGTALKPAHEPIVMARKPLGEKTVAKNVLKHGTGGLNIDGTRIGAADADERAARNGTTDRPRSGYSGGWNGGDLRTGVSAGRWPANVVLDEEAGRMLDEQTGKVGGGPGKHTRGGGVPNDWNPTDRVAHKGQTIRGGGETVGYGDSGGASRFFYCAKAGKKERNAGVPDGNGHPTVKPIALMRWLVRMVTPPDGLVLDPFCGSGTTAIAAISEGLRVVAIDRERDYVEIAARRTLHHWREALVG